MESVMKRHDSLPRTAFRMLPSLLQLSCDGYLAGANLKNSFAAFGVPVKGSAASTNVHMDATGGQGLRLTGASQLELSSIGLFSALCAIWKKM